MRECDVVDKHFIDYGYLKLDQFIPKRLIDDMFKWYNDNFSSFVYTNDYPMTGTTWCLDSAKWEDAEPFNRTQNYIINKMQEMFHMRVVPTYNMGRVYTKDTTGMVKHRDRSPCEISFTLPLAYDGLTWPINVRTSKGPRAINLKVGDALLYKGCDVDHWRDDNRHSNVLYQHYFHFYDLESETGSFLDYFNNKGRDWPGAFDRMEQLNDIPPLSENDRAEYIEKNG